MLVGSAAGQNTKECQNTEKYPLDPEYLNFGKNELRSIVFNLVNPIPNTNKNADTINDDDDDDDLMSGIKTILTGFINLNSVTIENLNFTFSKKDQNISLEYTASGCFSTSGNTIQVKATHVPAVDTSYWNDAIMVPVEITDGDLSSKNSKISKKIEFWNFEKSLAFKIILNCDSGLIPSSLEPSDMPVSNFIRARFLWGSESIENGKEKLRNFSTKKSQIFGIGEEFINTMLIKTDYYEVRTHMDIFDKVIYQSSSNLQQKNENLPKVEFLNSEKNGLQEATIVIPQDKQPEKNIGSLSILGDMVSGIPEWENSQNFDCNFPKKK